ncbi:serine/threonine-protein kinase [Actinomadura gamaensis]|uniref:non-specific serine/threonine protein kinase n=1 Tax=Actinomadura gamaensis TaxID=1763541 RepID=A0ABV9TZF8_9ACTN
MRPGEVIADRLVLREPLGAGGFGEVWRATDTVLGRDVAVKLMLPARTGPADRARFVREARTAGALRHRHIVVVHDLGQAVHERRPVLYLVMELLEGRTLGAVLAEGPPPLPLALRWAVQTCDALAAAHRAGVVHRDVKPDNIMVTPDGEVKVVDFGIAKAAAELGAPATSQVIGSPPYVAPRGRRDSAHQVAARRRAGRRATPRPAGRAPPHGSPTPWARTTPTTSSCTSPACPPGGRSTSRSS